ncbi:hypothetical protein [Legionella waltersii]|uniref:Ankyrin repeat-containing protein n=1 Tax=Legionella waltersii TaxID=66969 RepID=A0A0W1A803_9GAMM|nr:hypothetical protein [Legionella waltersii]KTD77187.1 ankyrin repeat-containing protein [Legionella waltersii]
MPAQTKIINSVNKLLSQKDSSLKLNEGGVCGGLASVYIRYCLEGRKSDFFMLSRLLVNPPKDYHYGSGHELDYFIRDIEIEFNRRKYSRGMSYQGDLEDSVLIKGKPIKKEFTLGLVTTKNSWAKILEGIRHNGRACYFRSHNHAIAVEFNNNQFEIFDPNYNEDDPESESPKQANTKSFATAKEVIDELNRQFHYPQDELTGLGIHVYADPEDKQVVTYPNKKQLLANELDTPKKLENKLGVVSKDWTYNSLFFATCINDVDTIEHLFKKEVISTKDMAHLMLMPSNDPFAKSYFKDCKAQNDKLSMMAWALWAGNAALFASFLLDYEKTYLQNSPNEKETFKKYIGNNAYFLSLAAGSGSSDCLQQVINLYKKYGVDSSQFKTTQVGKILGKLTKHGDSKCMEVFATYIKLPKEQLRQAILSAATIDKRSALQFWLGQWKMLGQTTPELLSKQLVEVVTPMNFELLLQAGFTIHSSVTADLLNRRNIQLFRTWAKSTPWKEIIEQIDSNTYVPENIDLFHNEQGISLLHVLSRFKLNKLIKDNFPENAEIDQIELGLKIACETGNRDLVISLSKKGFRLEMSYQINLLKQALDSKNTEVVRAVLASNIDFTEFFNNKDLIKQLIASGEYEFVKKAWGSLSWEQKSSAMTDALSEKNNDLLQFISREKVSGEALVYQYLMTLIKADKESYYPYCVRLAEALSPPTLSRLLVELTQEYEQKLLFRTTRDNPREDRAYKEEIRTEIGHLIHFLQYTIRNHNLHDFAAKLASQVTLTADEQFELFVEANQKGDMKVVEFLISIYPYILQNKDILFRLEEAGHYKVLNKILMTGRSLSPDVYIQLLKRAVAKRNEDLISTLSEYANSAYKIQGSALYQALEEGNVEGILLLIKHGARLNSYPLPNLLFRLAIKQGNTQLLEVIMVHPDFIPYFNEHIVDNIHEAFIDGSSASVTYLFKTVTHELYFEEFMKYAFEHDDLNLFRELQSEPSYKSLSAMQLFKTACQHQSQRIANEILKTPIRFDDRRDMDKMLDSLFGISNESSVGANDIYDIVYKKTLHRLYEFMRDQRYRPFASLHQSIKEVLDDENLKRKGLLRNNLLRRALDDKDPEKVNQFMLQLVEKPKLDKSSLKVFSDNLDNALMINVLFEHYSISDVLEEALIDKNWKLIIGLLKERRGTEIREETLEHLKSAQTSLLQALIVDAQQRFREDPRHYLNQLVSENCPLALAQILKEKKKDIEDAIMDLQDKMERAKIDLKQHFYRFDLRDQLIREHKAFEEIEPKVEGFLSKIAHLQPAEVIQNEIFRNELGEIHGFLSKRQLPVSYFDERWKLTALFDEFQKYQMDHQKLEQERQRKETEERQRKEHEERQRKEHEERQRKEHEERQRKEHEERQRKEHEERQRKENEEHQRKEHEERQRKEHEERLRKESEARERELNVKQELASKTTSTLEENTDEIQAQRPKVPKSEVEMQPLQQSLSSSEEQGQLTKVVELKPNGFERLLKDYIVERNTKDWTYHMLSLFQYTKKDKIDAATLFIDALKSSNVMISTEVRKTLKNGSLGSRIETYIKDHGQDLKQELNSSEDFESIDQVIDFLNQRDPIKALITALNKYKEQRSNDARNMYHFALFPQFTKQEKLTAVNNLIRTLETQSDLLTEYDMSALAQGRLGEAIEGFIKQYNQELADKLGVDEINDLVQLVLARVKPAQFLGELY